MSYGAAAVMAGEWWAERLHDAHASKRAAFAEAVARRVDEALAAGECSTKVDYDPCPLLRDALIEVGLQVSGPFSADGVLPAKHALLVEMNRLRPKEGYGNVMPDITVASE